MLTQCIKEVAEDSIYRFWQRQVMYVAGFTMAGFYLDPIMGLIGYFICLASEVIDWLTCRYLMGKGRLTEKNAPRLYRLLLLNVTQSAMAIAITGNMAAMVTPGEIHIIPLLFTFGAALYGATNNHQLRSVLAIRFSIYAMSLLLITGRELLPVLPPVSSMMWLQFACSLMIAYLILDCSIAYRRLFVERIEKMEELRDARDSARQAYDDRNAMISALTHDLRTPLNAMLGTAQLLDMTKLTKKQHEYAQTIISAGWFMNTLLTDILDSERLSAGKMTIAPVDGDLSALLHEVVGLHSGNAKAKGLSLSLTIDERVPKALRFDPVRVMQAVNNLVSNAVKFTSEGGVSLHASFQPAPKGGVVSIAVRDTGSGISPEDASRLFAPFEQAGSSAFAYGASGLGLWISRNLMHLMGGDIALDSVVGTGSTFTMTFDSIGGYAVAPETAALLKGLRVLFVENSEDLRQATRHKLEPYGIVCTDAATAEEAFEKLEQDHFDLTLIDVHLPGISGTEMVRRMRGMAGPVGALPTIALSSVPDLADPVLLSAIGFDEYVPKPIDERVLISTITAALQDNEYILQKVG